jgi:ABC-2 type transport system ATP-binding protein
MKKLGRKQLTVHLARALDAVPDALATWEPRLASGGHDLVYEFEASNEQAGIPPFLRRLAELGLDYTDLNTRQSSLEDIFVSLVTERK